MAIVRWTPYKELLDMPREMTRLFGRPFTSLLGEPFFGLDTMRAPMDVYSKGDDMYLRLELPGIRAEDVDITLAGHELTIKGERHEDKEVREDDYFRRERTYGSFERTLPLPEKVTEKDIEASFEDGILEVRVRGAVATVPAKHIEVKASSESSGRKIEPRKG
jgi:HSP20 family protein